MVDVIIMRSNSIIYNPRVRKISRSLSKKYSVLVLGWNREGLPKSYIDNFFVRLKLFGLKAPFGKRSLLLYLPLFWIWILTKLLKYRPKVVHACDLDIVLPCYIYKVIFRRKLIFDVCDRYAMAYVPPRYKRVYGLVNSIEEFFAQRSDVLVNVSERLLGTFRKKPFLCAIIMNCAEDHPIARVKSKTANLKILHSGGIVRTRGLEQLTSAIKDLANVEIHIAGRVIHEDLKNALIAIPYVKYHGLLSLSEVLALEAQCDVSVAFYDPKDPINEFSMGNKIFEAMMLGLPVITNVASEIVNEVGNGFLVDYDDTVQIRKVIVTLRDDPELRVQLGNRGRMAFDQKFNWNKMEQELYNFYDALLDRQ